MTAAVLTISDSAKAGSRADLSGPALVELLKGKGFTVVATYVVADELGDIEAALIQLSEMARLVVTTGGTGIARRDVTPEATRAICERTIPGMAELMRTAGLKRTPFASLSRAVCGTRGKTLIINVPGNPKAAVDSLEAVIPVASHALDLLDGKTAHAAESK